MIHFDPTQDQHQSNESSLDSRKRIKLVRGPLDGDVFPLVTTKNLKSDEWPAELTIGYSSSKSGISKRALYRIVGVTADGLTALYDYVGVIQ
jgi:hypothetical protein